MTRKTLLNKITITVPRKKMSEKPLERLAGLSDKTARSLGYLALEAILQYLGREERR